MKPTAVIATAAILTLMLAMLVIALLVPAALADPFDAPRYNPSSSYLDRRYESSYDYERKYHSYYGTLPPTGRSITCRERRCGRRPRPLER